MMMPKVSIVIPAYNAMVYLPKTIDNVLNQTFTDFEVLIINNIGEKFYFSNKHLFRNLRYVFAGFIFKKMI
jgi:cellulose synthase/poly-beta-1,6-N-acetylglucosamine synthase-like glycosyltransferase